MTATETLAELHQRGVMLEPNGDRLRYSGPKGALTSELREAIAENRTEIIAVLNQATGLIDLPFPAGCGGLPLAQVQAAEAVMDGLKITDPVLRKHNVLVWVLGYYQDRGENHGEGYEALTQEQQRLSRILEARGVG